MGAFKPRDGRGVVAACECCLPRVEVATGFDECRHPREGVERRKQDKRRREHDPEGIGMRRNLSRLGPFVGCVLLNHRHALLRSA